MDQTDLEKWITFFDIYGVNSTKTTLKDGEIRLNTDEGVGYHGFSMEIAFNENGSFISYGVWE